MIKLIAHLYTGYCGSDIHVAVSYEDGTSEDEISEDLYWMAVDNAERFGIYPYPDDDDDLQEGAEYSNGIEASYETYDKEVHDQHRQGGGSFEQDF